MRQVLSLSRLRVGFGVRALVLACALPLAASAQSSIAPTPVAEYWLRVYPTPAFGEIWRLTIEVADFEKGLSKAIAVLDKRGESVLPLENMAGSEKAGFQQLSYRLAADAAPKAFAALQKLGEVQELQKNPGVIPAVRDEVREKLAKLKADRDSNAAAFAGMPAASAAVSEIIAHLEAVEKANAEAEGRVLLNLQIRRRPTPAKP